MHPRFLLENIYVWILTFQTDQLLFRHVMLHCSVLEKQRSVNIYHFAVEHGATTNRTNNGNLDAL